MAKQKNQYIVLGIIVLVALLYLLPNLNLFAILPTGECNYKEDNSFITNVNYGQPESMDAYYALADTGQAWIAVDWNGDGQLEAFGNAQRTLGPAPSDYCASKTIITRTVSGLRVVKYAESSAYNEVAICSEDGKNLIFFDSNVETTAVLDKTQCSNYVAPCIPDNSCASQTYTNSTCVNNCGTIITGIKVIPTINNQTNQTNVTCVRNVQIGAWGNCTNGNKTRTVNVINDCGIPDTTSTKQACSNNVTCDTGFKLENGLCVKQSFFEQYLFWIIGGIALLIILLLLR